MRKFASSSPLVHLSLKRSRVLFFAERVPLLSVQYALLPPRHVSLARTPTRARVFWEADRWRPLSRLPQWFGPPVESLVLFVPGIFFFSLRRTCCCLDYSFRGTPSIPGGALRGLFRFGFSERRLLNGSPGFGLRLRHGCRHILTLSHIHIICVLIRPFQTSCIGIDCACTNEHLSQ